jgi:transcriptional regulator with XRE-family HTH domain
MSLLSQRLNDAVKLSNPKVTQADIARKAKVEKSSVNAWFSGGTQMIKADVLFVIADLLKVSPRWLATGQGSMNVNEIPGLYLVNNNTTPKPETIKTKRLEQAFLRIERTDLEFCDRSAAEKAMLTKFAYDSIEDNHDQGEIL